MIQERSTKLFASGDSLTRRQKWKRVAAYQKEEPINKPPETEKPSLVTQKEEPEEQDQDLFYSPSSQVLEEQSSSSGDEQSTESVKGDRFGLESLEDLSERSEMYDFLYILTLPSNLTSVSIQEVSNLKIHRLQKKVPPNLIQSRIFLLLLAFFQKKKRSLRKKRPRKNLKLRRRWPKKVLL